MPFHPKRKSYPHTFCLSFWQSTFLSRSHRDSAVLCLWKGQRRWLSLLVSERVRREAQSPGTGSPLTAAGETKTLSKTVNSKEGDRRALKCSSPSWIKWEEVGSQQGPVSTSYYGQESGMTWRRSEALSRVWPLSGPCSLPVTISFCASPACCWQEQLPADAPSQGRALEATPDRQSWPRLVAAASRAPNPAGNQRQTRGESCWSGRNHLSCTCATERNSQKSRPWAINNISGITNTRESSADERFVVVINICRVQAQTWSSVCTWTFSRCSGFLMQICLTKQQQQQQQRPENMLLIWRRISSMHPGKFREEIAHLGCIAVNTFSQAFPPTERKAKTSWLWGINQIRNREGKPTKYPQGVWQKNCDASEHLTWYSPTENEREAKA